MKVKCIIVDDEPLAIEVIDSHIKKFDDIEVIARCSNAVKAFEILQNKQVDLIFLDIQMPKITGIDFLRTLKNPPKVIITTAYRDYAIEGYELDVIDYLLKPISFERFFKAIQKFYQISNSVKNEMISPIIVNNFDEGEFIYVRADKKMQKIFLKDILYIESLKDYIKIFTSAKSVITKQPISSFEEKLPENIFLRTHRSFIISIPKIEAFSTQSIEISGKEIPIGRSYKNIVMKTLNFKEE
jgi:DNA-binding LytR/AlgR family response regulator